MKLLLSLVAVSWVGGVAVGQAPVPVPPPAPMTDAELKDYIKQNYTKTEYRIPMRDGTKLFTSVYSPKDDNSNFMAHLSRVGVQMYQNGSGSANSVAESREKKVSGGILRGNSPVTKSDDEYGEYHCVGRICCRGSADDRFPEVRG